VEIDESLFGKRKHNRGQRKDNGQWVFGGVERDSGKCFLVPVEKRDAGTLLPIIFKYILPGTIIYSDKWAAYNRLR
jgi:transposase-like protein